MPSRRRSRPDRRPRPRDLQRAPETDAVRLPPEDEPYRGDGLAERVGGALKEPRADAGGEGSVQELAEDMPDSAIRRLEKNAQKTEPRASKRR